jgi:hypothetical protein
LLRRLLPDKNKIRLNSKEEKMKYTVDKSVFELNPDIKFGIIVGENIINSETGLMTDPPKPLPAEIKPNMVPLFSVNQLLIRSENTIIFV